MGVNLVRDRTVEDLLKGLKQVTTYKDDIFVTGTLESDHIHMLEEVLSRLEAAEFG